MFGQLQWNTTSLSAGHATNGKIVYVCVCVCVCQGIDGQHRLVLVWGLDLCWVIISDPPLCFHDPVLESWPITPLSTPVRAQLGPTSPRGWDPLLQRHGTHTQINTHTRAPFVAYFTPHLLLLLLPNGKGRSGGGGEGDQGKRLTEWTSWENSAECPLPPCIFSWKDASHVLTAILAREGTSWWAQQIYRALMVRLCSVSYKDIGMIHIFKESISRTRKLLMQGTPKAKQKKSAEGRCVPSLSRSVKKHTLCTAAAPVI